MTHAKQALGTRLLSLAIVFSLVFTGLFVVIPIADDIAPGGLDTMGVARAGDPLPPGDLPGHQDGVAGDGADVLVIFDYFFNNYRPVHPSYGNRPDYGYIRVTSLVDDLHFLGYTVDTWYCHPTQYQSTPPYYGPGRQIRGTYDGLWYRSYYPVDSRGYEGCIDNYDAYRAVIISGQSSALTFGSYNYNGQYETARPVTAERTMTGFEDYVGNGGSVFLSSYYLPYYGFYSNYYVGNVAVRNAFQARLGAMFDCTYNTYSMNTGGTGYGIRGFPGETPGGAPSIGYSSRDYEDLWGSVYSGINGVGQEMDISVGDRMFAPYHYVLNPSFESYANTRYYMNYNYQYYKQEPTGDGIKCVESSNSYGYLESQWRYQNTGGVQSDHGGDFNTVALWSNPYYMTSYYRHSSGSYYFYDMRMMPAGRIPLLGSIMDFIAGGPPPQPEASAPGKLVEVADSPRDEDEFFEFINDATVPVNLSHFYLVVARESASDASLPLYWPTPAQDYSWNGDSDLTAYDPGTDGNADDGLLQPGEMLYVPNEMGVQAIDSSGMVAFYNTSNDKIVGDPLGWGSCGPALNPVSAGTTTAYSSQLYYDSGSGKYSKKGEWTIARASPNATNNVDVPALGDTDIVINEVYPDDGSTKGGNNGFVELYNRGTSSVSLAGWWLAVGDTRQPLSGSLSAGDFVTYNNKDIHPFRDSVALFDDLNVLVNRIGWNTTVDWNMGDAGNFSVADGMSIARHMDGMGADNAYNDTTATVGNNWNLDKLVEPNLRWEVTTPTKGYTNYDGFKTLVYNDKVKDLVAGLASVSLDTPYAGGVVTMAYNKIYMGNFDVVIMSDSSIDGADSQLILDYLNSGGSLYMICGNVDGIGSSDLRTTLGYSTVLNEALTVDSVTVNFEEFVNDDLEVGDASLTEYYTVGENAYEMLTGNNRVVGAFTVGNDAETSYRMIYTGVDINKMMDDEITVKKYLEVVMDWFTKPNINHNPVVTLDDDFLPEEEDGSDLHKISEFDMDGDYLSWKNDDQDPWDQAMNEDDEYLEMTFKLYISTDRSDVFSSDAAAYKGETNMASFIPDLGMAGYYYFKVDATDRYGGVGSSEIGEFLYDNENPVVDWFKPVFLELDGDDVKKVTIGDDIGSEILPEEVRVFGIDNPGVPNYVAIRLTDNYLLKMAGSDISRVNVSFSASGPGTDGEEWGDIMFDQLVLKGSDDLTMYSKALYEDLDGNTVDLKDEGNYPERITLNDENELTVYIAPPEGFTNDDGKMPDGWYAITVMVKDSVKNPRNDAEINAYFQVDYNPPEKAGSFNIVEKDYVNTETGEVFVQGGKLNTITFEGGSTLDPTLDLVELQMSSGTKGYGDPFASNWETMGRWDTIELPDSGHYEFMWTPSTLYDSIRVVSWDRAGNYAVSDFFNKFTVDAAVPYEPTNLDIQVDDGTVSLEGKVRDKGGSGVAYVEIFLNDWDNPVLVKDLIGGGFNTQAQINPSDFFRVEFSLESVGLDGKGDIYNIIRVRAVDNVDNVGPMTDETAMPTIRVIQNGFSANVLITEPKPGRLTQEENEVRDISLSILTFKEGDTKQHTLTMIYHAGKPAGIPSDVVWLRGYWEVSAEGLETGGAFLADLTVNYFLKQNTQIREDDLILVTKSKASDPWMDMGARQIVDKEQGIHQFYVDELRHFSYFAVIAGKPNLYIEDVVLGRLTALKNQEMDITITVGNEGDFAKRAGTSSNPVTAEVSVEYTDSKGRVVQTIIADEVKFGVIEPDATRTAKVTWMTPDNKENLNRMEYTIRIRLDRPNYVDESNEDDNEFTDKIFVVKEPVSVSSFGLTPALMMLSLVAVLGMAHSLRRKLEKKDEEDL